MWTKLMYVNFLQGLNPQLVKGKWHRPVLSGLNRQRLRWEFRIHNVPWIFNKPKDPSLNPRHIPPKDTKWQKNRPTRLAKIKKNLEEADNLILKYRQEKMNARKLSGFDYILSKTLPSWMEDVARKEDKMGMEEEEDADKKERNLFYDIWEIKRDGNRFKNKKKKVQ